MLGRRGPAQAAFTPPELKELGELGAPTSPSTRPTSSSTRRARQRSRRTGRARRNVDILREFAARTPAGKAEAPRASVSSSRPSQILGEGRVEAIEVVRNQLVPDGGRGDPRGADGRARDDPLRPRVPQRRLPGRRSSGCPVRRERGDDAQRRGACWTSGAAASRRLLRGLDQARADRSHRHQQEGRDRDRRAPPRRRTRRRLPRRAETGRGGRRAARERGVDVVGYAGWEPIDRRRGARGEPPAGRASSSQLGRAARGGPRG